MPAVAPIFAVVSLAKTGRLSGIKNERLAIELKGVCEG
jgi:hypothetical protein